MGLAGVDQLTRTSDDAQRVRRRRLTNVAVAVVLVIGLGASSMAGHWWSAQVRHSDDATLDDKARDVGNSVAALLARQADITDGAQTFVQVSPGITPADFQRWFEAVADSRRHPGLQLFGFVEVVPAADTVRLNRALAEMGARINEISPGAADNTSFDLTLNPSRGEYCLMTAIAGDLADFRTNIEAIAPEYRKVDVCDTPVGRYLEQARDNGTIMAVPWGSPNVIAFAAPRYTGTTVPVTVEERRAALIGIMGGIVDARVLLGSAAGQDGPWLGLERVQPDGTLDPLATSADQRPGNGATRTVTIDADGPWQLTVAGLQTPTGTTAPAQGLVLGIVGGMLTILLAALVAVLLRGRDRALRLVEERTSELRHLALHDPLTGLANRLLIADRAQHMIQRARRRGQDRAALFIDLDGFKDINDSIGHEAGDRLLQLVAQRFQDVLREGDTVGRMGGDEFVILLDGDDNWVDPEAVAARVLAVMREPFWLLEGETAYTVTASVGVAVGRYDDASELLRDADVAVYKAKAAGRDCHVLFLPEMQAAVEDRLAMAMELRKALELDELSIEYQPTFDMTDMRVNGFEALIRWTHGTRGSVPPTVFVPVAEDTGLIVELGTWVLHQACNQVARWNSAGHQLKINVNVSSRQLEQADFAEIVADALLHSGLDPRALVLEITESTLMEDADAVATRLTELKKLGIQVAIDDFGTGYSSLAYLRQFPVDSIKIDQSFVADLGRSPEAEALMHSLIQLGKNLGLDTYAEGIERDDQVTYLCHERCDFGQGFLFAPPLSAAAAGQLLASSDRSGVVVAQEPSSQRR